MFARNTIINLYTGGVNVAENIGQFIKSFKYSDSMKDEGDSVEIVFADTLHTMLNTLTISKGNSINIEVVTENSSTNIGEFEVDEISYKAPPSELTIKLNSIPASNRGAARYKSWEQVSLSYICADIAATAGLSFSYNADDFYVERVEQTQTPNLEFLKKLCKNYGLNMKITNGTLYIYSAEKLESQSPTLTITYGDNNIINFNARTTANFIYESAGVSFLSNGIADWLFGGNLFGGVLGEILGSATTGNNDLTIYERVENEAQAEILAQSRLHDKNKKEWSFNITILGNMSLRAGVTIQLNNFGLYSGKYMIERADHNISSGFTTSLNCYRV